MSQWKYVRLGDECLVERGGSPRPIEEYITTDESGINWIKIGDTTDSMFITSTAQKIIPEGQKKSRNVFKGDFLLSNSMSFGRPYILKIDGCIHDGWLVIRDQKEIFNKHFLYYFLSSPKTYEHLKSLAVGGVVNNLNTGMVKNLMIPVPTHKEQKEIADKFDKIELLLTLRKQQLSKLDQLVKARFVEMFGEFFSTHKNMLPLEKICHFIDYRGKTPEKSERGIPLITAKNVKDNIFSIDPREYIPEENYASVMTRGFPQANDVLFTTEAPLGNVCRIPDIYEKFCVGQRIITMQPNECMTSEYLEFALLSKEFQEKIWQKASGSTVKGIRSKLLEKLTLPVPPRHLQEKFAAFVQKVDKSKAAVKQSLEKLETLKNL